MGAETPFLRPKYLAKDNTPVEQVIYHAINFYKKKKIKFDYFFLLQPTSPFRNNEDLINSWKLLNKNKKYTSVFSVSLAEANNNPYWMIKKNKFENVVKFIDNGPISNLLPRRQLLPKVYYRNDFIYIGKVNNFMLKKPNLYGSNPAILITDKNRIHIDINNSVDWYIAEKLFQYK